MDPPRTRRSSLPVRALAALARLPAVLVQLVWSLCSLLWIAATRRRGPLVFTHHQDVDEDGLDRQMGPLVDALQVRSGRLIEICAVPFGIEIVHAITMKGRPFVSHALILGGARLLAPWSPTRTRLIEARTTIATLILRLLRPSVLFVIDESGSGQALVRAARALGIRSVGVQHGDFQPANPQYAALPGVTFDRVPADVLCLWSPWFLDRLVRVSPIYGAANTRVTGRLRYAEPGTSRPPGTQVRVLFLGEATPGYRQAIAPFWEALARDPACTLRYRPHPAERRGLGVPDVEDSAPEALRAADVVAGCRTSALLEALWFGRPVVVLGIAGLDVAETYHAEGLAPLCGDPAELPGLVRRLASPEGEDLARSSRDRVWGGAPADPVEAVLSAGFMGG